MAYDEREEELVAASGEAARAKSAIAGMAQAVREAEAGRDPWAHRGPSMRCKTCMWFVPKYPEEPAILVGNKITLPPINVGRCRRHAPTMAGYPVVYVNDWCGDHKLDENKL
jgi:hypothetical protein